MTTQFRLLAAACAVLLCAGTVALFTVDGDAGDDVAAENDTTTTSAAGDGDEADGSETSEAGDASSTSSPDDEADSSSTTATTAGDTSPSSTAPPSSTTTAPPTTAPTTAGIPERTPTDPGAYTYDVEGCCDQNGNDFSGISQLTVEAPQADGTQRQVQEGPDGRTVTVYRHADEGTYLVSMQLSTPQGSFTLRAEGDFLLIPADVDDGTRTTGRLRDGDLVADVTFTAVSVGPSESTAELHADISGSVTVVVPVNVRGTMDSTIRARTRDQLPLETTSTTRITKPDMAAGTSNVHSVLRR